MDLIRELVRGLYSELVSMFNWALKNWALTMAAVIVAVYWASKHKRANKHP